MKLKIFILLFWAVISTSLLAKEDRTQWIYAKSGGAFDVAHIEKQVASLSTFVSRLKENEYFTLKIGYVTENEFQNFLKLAGERIRTNRIRAFEIEGIRIDSIPKAFSHNCDSIYRLFLFECKTNSLLNFTSKTREFELRIERDSLKTLPKEIENVGNNINFSIINNLLPNLETESAFAKMSKKGVELSKLFLVEWKTNKIQLPPSIYKFKKLTSLKMIGDNFKDVRDDIHTQLPNLVELGLLSIKITKLPKELFKYDHDIYISLLEDLYEKSFKLSEKYKYLHFDKTCR